MNVVLWDFYVSQLLGTDIILNEKFISIEIINVYSIEFAVEIFSPKSAIVTIVNLRRIIIFCVPGSEVADRAAGTADPCAQSTSRAPHSHELSISKICIFYN